MDVAVVGSGVIGLTTAARLLEAGHAVRVVSADPLELTTSWLAAAVWFPTHVGLDSRVARWGATTYDELARQAAAGVPGVVMRDSLSLYRAEPGRPDWTRAVGDVRAARVDELPAGYPFGLRYAVPAVEMPLYLPWLAETVRTGGGRLEARRISALDELGDAEVVVNCSGLGARELAGDSSVHPVRGQVARVENLGLTMSVRDEGHPDGRAYVHPRRHDVVLGGTFEPDRWDTEPEPSTAASILRRCAQIVPALAEARVLEHVVGLRPARPEVRLEVEPAADPPVVIHNYGHGGSGVTLSWGCADDVAALVAQS